MHACCACCVLGVGLCVWCLCSFEFSSTEWDITTQRNPATHPPARSGFSLPPFFLSFFLSFYNYNDVTRTQFTEFLHLLSRFSCFREGFYHFFLFFSFVCVPRLWSEALECVHASFHQIISYHIVSYIHEANCTLSFFFFFFLSISSHSRLCFHLFHTTPHTTPCVPRMMPYISFHLNPLPICRVSSSSSSSLTYVRMFLSRSVRLPFHSIAPPTHPLTCGGISLFFYTIMSRSIVDSTR